MEHGIMHVKGCAEPIWFGMPRAWSPWCGVPAAKLARAQERTPTCDTSHTSAQFAEGRWRKARVASATLTFLLHLFVQQVFSR